MAEALARLTTGEYLVQDGKTLYLATQDNFRKAALQNIESWYRPGMLQESTVEELEKARVTFEKMKEARKLRRSLCDRCMMKGETLENCKVYPELKPLDYLFDKECPYFINVQAK